MSNQSPCTDPLYPCTALTLAEKNYALEQLTWLRKHMLAVNFREYEALDAAIRALRKATTVDDCRVRRIPVYGMGQARDAVYSQRGDDYLLEAECVRYAGERLGESAGESAGDGGGCRKTAESAAEKAK